MCVLGFLPLQWFWLKDNNWLYLYIRPQHQDSSILQVCVLLLFIYGFSSTSRRHPNVFQFSLLICATYLKIWLIWLLLHLIATVAAGLLCFSFLLFFVGFFFFSFELYDLLGFIVEMFFLVRVLLWPVEYCVMLSCVVRSIYWSICSMSKSLFIVVAVLDVVCRW